VKLKVDENLGRSVVQVLRDAGHDVATVPGQHLCSASDGELISVCQRERRCLVTLDLDFANPLEFRPSAYPGIAVLRVPRPDPAHLHRVAATLVRALAAEPIDGRLWVVEPHRVRMHQGDDELTG
jgi:predicted nuclease of predicted toxin-antitoxin system